MESFNPESQDIRTTVRELGRSTGRIIAPENTEDALYAAKRILAFIGDDPERESIKDTPARMVLSWGKLFGGYKMDPEEILSTCFASSNEQMVILRNIEFFSTCEHHFLPFFGMCHIAYVPCGTVVGISKLARLVECFSRRLQIQENMTEQIADAIQAHLKPRGVAVMAEAKHLCMVSRGVQKQSATMVSTSLHGVLLDDRKAREEFLSCVKGQ